MDRNTPAGSRARISSALVAAGTYDATLAAAYAGRNIELLVFPMRAPGIPDAAKATGSATTYLYRRKGTPADYVNGRFVRLSGPVGVTAGFQASTEMVLKGGGQVYDGAKSADQLAKMLLAGEVHDGDVVPVHVSADGERLVLG